MKKAHKFSYAENLCAFLLQKRRPLFLIVPFAAARPCRHILIRLRRLQDLRVGDRVEQNFRMNVRRLQDLRFAPAFRILRPLRLNARPGCNPARRRMRRREPPFIAPSAFLRFGGDRRPSPRRIRFFRIRADCRIWPRRRRLLISFFLHAFKEIRNDTEQHKGNDRQYKLRHDYFTGAWPICPSGPALLIASRICVSALILFIL